MPFMTCLRSRKILGTLHLGSEGWDREEGGKWSENQIKARLVAKGFQEEDKVQLDSPMAQRESFQMFILTAFNIQMEMLCLIKITTAFLQ